jgi:hypothetical protein
MHPTGVGTTMWPPHSSDDSIGQEEAIALAD